ncbi:MAG: hypothetical protein QM528_09120 [Phycisphaerales bacterium]|nr:hypothetical protein [Phycisphaerales bacterium]
MNTLDDLIEQLQDQSKNKVAPAVMMGTVVDILRILQKQLNTAQEMQASQPLISITHPRGTYYYPEEECMIGVHNKKEQSSPVYSTTSDKQSNESSNSQQPSAPIQSEDKVVPPIEPENIIEKNIDVIASKQLFDNVMGHKAPVPDIQKANSKKLTQLMGINDRLLFVNELFNKNNELFQKTVADLDACSSYQDAKSLLIQRSMNWNEEDKVVQQFDHFLKLHYKK